MRKGVPPPKVTNWLLSTLGLINETYLKMPEASHEKLRKLPRPVATFNLETLLYLSRKEDITFQQLISFLEARALAIDSSRLGDKFDPDRSPELRQLEKIYFPEERGLATVTPPGKPAVFPMAKPEPAVAMVPEELRELALKALDQVLEEQEQFRKEKRVESKPARAPLLESPTLILRNEEKLLARVQEKTAIIEKLVKSVLALDEKQIYEDHFWETPDKLTIPLEDDPERLPIINSLVGPQIAPFLGSRRFEFLEKMRSILRCFVNNNYRREFMRILEKGAPWRRRELDEAVAAWAEEHLPLLIDKNGEVFSEETVLGRIIAILREKSKD